ncbi:MAG: hypothetical protein M1833_006499 [Piccolia ochrophora]|nr:MAG: hypothetical protein M1833_006499 [Piccolia ochrophora]
MASAKPLLAGCRLFSPSCRAFDPLLAERKQGSVVALRPSMKSVDTGVKTLEKGALLCWSLNMLHTDSAEEQLFVVSNPTSGSTHTLRSSNDPYYNAVWEAAHRSKGVDVPYASRSRWGQLGNDRYRFCSFPFPTSPWDYM